MKKLLVLFSAVTAMIFGNVAMAQVHVTDPWTRATLEHQPTAGVYLQLLSWQDTRLIAARSVAAENVEIHEIKMENGIMKMRPVDFLDLPAGKPVVLKPGSFHIMLSGLKRQLREGEMMPLVLFIKDGKGKRQSIELQVPVHPLTGPATH